MKPSQVLFAALLSLSACKGGDELPPTLVLSGTALDFGTVALGASAERSFTLSNGGGEVVEVLSVQLVEGDSDLFTVDREGSMLLGDGLDLTVTVRFTPEAEERSLGFVQVRYDDGTSGSVGVDLVGEGSPSEADADADGWRVVDGDCDDGDATVHPGAEEVCDGQDNNCDGEGAVGEQDADGDGWLECAGDCNDEDSAVHPGAEEVCDGQDSDCDGVNTDDTDTDGDGATLCEGDCDDAEPLSFPGATEVCDGVDNDCDGQADNLDADGDGHSICSAAGDCDDDDKKAYPVVVDASWTGTQSGTDAEPYRTLAEAMDHLDRTCRTVWLADGRYEADIRLTNAGLTLVGESEAGVVLTAPAGERHLEVSVSSTLTLRTLTVSGGQGDGDGGALSASSSALSLEQVTFSGNTSGGDGGAVAVAGSTLTLEGCTFTGNTAGDDGGALSVLSSTFTDQGSTYTTNAGTEGGAILAVSSDVVVDGSTFWQNAALDRGGAIAFVEGSGLSVEGCVMSLNTAASFGGALSFVDVDIPGGVVRNNVLTDNDGGVYGGAIGVRGSDARFELANNTLVANTCTDDGAGLFVDAGEDGELTLLGNLIYRSVGDSGLYVDEQADHEVAYNTVYATSAGSSSNYAGPFTAGADNNTAEDPVFVTHSDDRDPTNDDLRLGSGSPAVDTGPPDPSYNDPDGSRNDRGHTGGPAATE